MDICISPKKLHGYINAIPSKSQAHRILICAAFADQPTTLICPETNRDIEATANCLVALGAGITRLSNGYRVNPIGEVPFRATLPCQDSGSTLRFLLPIAGALGVDTVFQMTGRLPQRPLSPLWEEMERMGCALTRPTADTIRCTGQLQSGDYAIDGNVSSQFITGLLFALSLLPGQSHLQVLGKLESAPYVSMTLAAMEHFGISCKNYCFPGNGRFHSPGTVTVEGDWSNAAFFLAARALGSTIQVGNLNPDSPQGDRACAQLLPMLKNRTTISAADIPDLVPILAVTAAANQGAVFSDIGRLRLKESDRVASVIEMLQALGGRAEADDTTLMVYGTGLHGGIVDCRNDHRIAMSAAIAATVCDSPVILLGAQCVEKSYPKFFHDYTSLGGQYEQYLR